MYGWDEWILFDRMQEMDEWDGRMDGWMDGINRWNGGMQWMGCMQWMNGMKG